MRDSSSSSVDIGRRGQGKRRDGETEREKRDEESGSESGEG
jgi:hypothetical protein